MTQSADAGVINATAPFTTAPPDASGGKGSFLPGLLNTLTSGINALANVKINEAVAKSLGGGLAAVNADGSVTYKAAQANNAKSPSSKEEAQAMSFFERNKTAVMTVGAVLIGGVILIAVLRR